MRCNKRHCPLKVDRWTNRSSPRRVSFRKMRSEQYSVYEIRNDRARRYSRIEQGKLNSRTTQFSHMRINDREKGFDVSYFIITRNKSQIQE